MPYPRNTRLCWGQVRSWILMHGQGSIVVSGWSGARNIPQFSGRGGEKEEVHGCVFVNDWTVGILNNKEVQDGG